MAYIAALPATPFHLFWWPRCVLVVDRTGEHHPIALSATSNTFRRAIFSWAHLLAAIFVHGVCCLRRRARHEFLCLRLRKGKRKRAAAECHRLFHALVLNTWLVLASFHGCTDIAVCTPPFFTNPPIALRRRVWYHARRYAVLVANPDGWCAFVCVASRTT